MGLKRALILEEEDSDDEDAAVRRHMSAAANAAKSGRLASAVGAKMSSHQGPPVNDVFRQRQQMKATTSPFAANNSR